MRTTRRPSHPRAARARRAARGPRTFPELRAVRGATTSPVVPTGGCAAEHEPRGWSPWRGGDVVSGGAGRSRDRPTKGAAAPVSARYRREVDRIARPVVPPCASRDGSYVAPGRPTVPAHVGRGRGCLASCRCAIPERDAGAGSSRRSLSKDDERARPGKASRSFFSWRIVRRRARAAWRRACRRGPGRRAPRPRRAWPDRRGPRCSRRSPRRRRFAPRARRASRPGGGSG